VHSVFARCVLRVACCVCVFACLRVCVFACFRVCVFACLRVSVLRVARCVLTCCALRVVPSHAQHNIFHQFITPYNIDDTLEEIYLYNASRTHLLLVNCRIVLRVACCVLRVACCVLRVASHTGGVKAICAYVKQKHRATRGTTLITILSHITTTCVSSAQRRRELIAFCAIPRSIGTCPYFFSSFITPYYHPTLMANTHCICGSEVEERRVKINFDYCGYRKWKNEWRMLKKKQRKQRYTIC
jgi:hypothetical protein